MKTILTILTAVELATGAWYTAALCFFLLASCVIQEAMIEADRREDAGAFLANLDAKTEASRKRIPSALRVRR